MSHKATHWAWTVKDISSSEKLILLALADRHNTDTGDCFPSLDRIAEDTCSSRNTVRRATQTLEDKGLIKRELITDMSGRTLGYRYHLVMGGSNLIPSRYQDDIKAISEGCQSGTGEGATVVRGGSHGGTHEGAMVVPKPVKETGKENHNSRSAPLAGFDDFWKVYPRKVAKGSAVKAWRSAIKKAPPDEITSAAGKYKWPDDPKFIPHPATWLNAERWADVEGTPKPSFVSTYRPPPPPPPPAPEMSPEHRAKMAARFNDLLASLGKAKGM